MWIRSSFVILLLGISTGKCDKSKINSGIRLFMKLFEDCQRRGFGSCMKVKAITFLDRIGRPNEIVLDDHLSLVRRSDVPPGPPGLTEMDLENSLPRGGDAQARESRLDDILLNRTAEFFNTHKIVFNLPHIDPSDLSKEVEEGRGKMKKMMSMMMMGLAMKKAAAVPLAIGFLFFLAKKAFIVSKLALILTLLVAMKKLKSSSK